MSPDYEVGPGDEIIIMLWGETESYNKYVVTKDGYVFIDNVGQVFVNGLTLAKLETKLHKLLKKVYSSIGSQGATSTSLDVTIGSAAIRPIRIKVLGEADVPGAYDVKASTTLSSSLYYFGGPSLSGSLRKIKLIRNSKEISEIDFYEFLLTGKQKDDLRLQQDDVVFFPPRGKTIKVEGAIKKEKYFELKDDEDLYDLIMLAGGIKAETYTQRAQIVRIIPVEKEMYQELIGKF